MMSANRSARAYRIGAAVVFLLLTAVVVVPLFDADQRTTLDRTFRIIGGIVLLGLAALSFFGPSGRTDRN
jgi:cytochrome c biogenesis protein CcdA